MSTLGRIHYRVVEQSRLRAPLVWLRHLGLRGSDILLASYPRSGQYWLRFQLGELLSGRPIEYDNLDRVTPELGRQRKAMRLLPAGGRLVQTHERYRNEYKKAVYIVRDVRDVVLSEYSQFKSADLPYAESFDRFLWQFVQGRLHDYPSWQDHVTDWLDSPIAESGNLLVTKFEDRRRSPEEELTKILRFLGGRIDTTAVRNAIRNNTVEAMRAKEDRRAGKKYTDEGGRHTRGGLVGGWHERLSREQLQLIEHYTGKVLLRLGYPLAEELNSAQETLRTGTAENLGQLGKGNFVL
jgi:Sulfotransferase domain